MTFNRKYGAHVLMALILTLALALPSVAYAARSLTPIEGTVKNDGVVLRAKGLQLSPKTKVLRVGSDGVGDSFTPIATVMPAGVDGNLQWTSSKPLVASVDSSGTVSAHKTGTATITCKTGDGSKLKRTISVAVKPVVPSAVSFEQSEFNLAPSGAKQLVWNIEPQNAVDKRVTFKSSNPKVAKVSATGVVTGVALGKATISAMTRAGGLIAKATVNVCYADSNIYYVAIGQEKYMRSSMDLEATVFDVNRFVKTLKSSNFGQRSMAGDTYFSLTGQAIRSVLAGIPSKYGVTENDITYLYYSGHGVAGGREMRGALAGTDFGYSSSSNVTVDEIRTYLDAVPGTVVVMMDSCLSGQFITPKGVQGKAATNAEARSFSQAMVDAFSASPVQVSSKGLNSLISGNANKNKYKIAVACKPMEDSYTDKIAGVFTRYLCEAGGISGEDNDNLEDKGYLPGDTNRNGYLSLKEAFQYASPRIVRWGKTTSNAKVQNMMVWPSDASPIFARIG